MPSNSLHRLASASLYAVAALAGLLIALIVVLNLHIIVGLEEGYATSPTEVVDSSFVLALVDVALLIAGPSLGILAMSKLRQVNR